MSGEDVLFDARNHFHLGHFQSAITEATSSKPQTDAAMLERDVLLHRAYVEQGNTSVVSVEINEGSAPALRAIKLLAAHKSADQSGRQAAVSALREILAVNPPSSCPHLSVVAAAIFCMEKDYVEALKCTHQGQTLEQLFMVSHLYIAMNRPDLAEKQVKLMQTQDDDATLTQLAHAQALIAKGTGHQDAFFIYQDLAEKYGTSPLLLNNMAACNMGLGNFEDAEQNLQEALGKNPTDPTTIANLIVCLQHLKKSPEVTARYVTQLRTSAPTHPWTESYEALERNFDRVAAQLSQ